MILKRPVVVRATLLVSLLVNLTVISSRLQADTGSCGGQTSTLPFTDVQGNFFFCSIAAAYFSGLTNGTSPTTYTPGQPVPREQMAAFVTRTLDQSLRRGSRRAALDQFWTTQGPDTLALTTLGGRLEQVKSDGADLWVADSFGSTVKRVRASDGKLLDTWFDVSNAKGVLVAMGKVYVTGDEFGDGTLYEINPLIQGGSGHPIASVGANPLGLAFDGQRIWTANFSGSVSIVSPPSVTTISTGFGQPYGILYDGANIWVTDQGDDSLKKLNSTGAILQSVPVGLHPSFPAFDGTNIWVPNSGFGGVSVVRVKDAAGNPLAQAFVLATLTGNGLGPQAAAFDGERILVTNRAGMSVSLWKASDLTPIGSFSTGDSTLPYGACSDGLNFWVTLQHTGHLARF